MSLRFWRVEIICWGRLGLLAALLCLPAVTAVAADDEVLPLEVAVQRRCQQLRAELATEAFQVFAQTPFIVIGNEPRDRVRRRCEGTVRWALQRLQQDFFAQLPRQPIEVWMLCDDASYRQVSADRFAVRPVSPFGYFASAHQAIVVNISTGAGTMVHEMVHPLMAASFPNCPVWLNEGLASLYEQCGDQDGHIWGYTNWRLPRLQASIRGQHLASLETICSMSAAEFYSTNAALNYAQARYLCLYLQDVGKLPQFVDDLRHGAAQDPSGYQTLLAVLGEEIRVDFQQRWEQFILGLEYDHGG